jgi:hypothetical protein
MSELILTENQISQFSILNQLVEAAEPKFSKIFTYDNLINECHILNTIESSIPEATRFNLHFDMIFNGTLTDYYKTLTGGTNYILEAARKIFPESQHITESIENFKEYLGSLITEESLALAMPTGAMSPGGVDAALTGGAMQANVGGGFWGTLKKLWNAVTEGGSAIGILQFVIDIIGVVGDFIFPGVGVVADIINAVIYAARGEWMLCAISAIAGIFIGVGDTLKAFKFVAKPAEKVMVALSKKGGAKEAAELIGKMGTKESGPVLKLLTSIAGFIGGALGKATSLLGKFIQSFTKVTKWIPGLGGPINWILKGLGSTLSKFGDKMTLFSANLKLMKTGAKETAAASMQSTIKAGGSFVVDGDWLKVINKQGKVVGKYPASNLAKLSAEQTAELATKKAGKRGSNILYKRGDDFVKTSKTFNNPVVQQSIRSRAAKHFGNAFIKAGKGLPFFIGKQIYKIIFNQEWVAGHSNWTKSEVLGHGDGAINGWIDDELKKKRKETGAVYVPSLELDSDDQETYDRVTAYQNNLAHLTGEPNIMQVITKNYDHGGAHEEFDNFFDAIAAGKIKYGDTTDKVDHTLVDNLDKTVTSNTPVPPNTEKTTEVKPYSSSPKFESHTVFSFADFKK